MSVVRPARSALGRCAASAAAPIAVTPCRQFHSSAMRAKRQPRFKNVKAEEMGLMQPASMDKFKKTHMPEYTAQELEQLAAKYTPEQLEAIKAGEKAIDAEDVLIQGRIRDDPYRPTYVDDYATVDPRYDLKPEVEGAPREHKWLDEQDWVDQFSMKISGMADGKTDKQIRGAMARALRRVKESTAGADMIDLTEEELVELENDPEMLKKYLVEDDAAATAEDDKNADPDSLLTEAQAQKLDDAIEAEWKKELQRLATDDAAMLEVTPSRIELVEDGPAGLQRAESAEAVELGKIPGVEGRYRKALDEDHGKDEMGEYQEIKRITGLNLQDVQSLYAKIIVRRSVANQTRMGKIRSSSQIAIAGNGNGRLGIGMAKSTDSQTAAITALLLAIRNMRAVRRYEDRTIYGNSTAKVGATVVELFNRPPGFGLRVPHRIFEMCRAVGLHDMAARMPRAKNPMNSVFATYKALMNQADPEEIARGRGKKLADARKVYYGGSVH